MMGCMGCESKRRSMWAAMGRANEARTLLQEVDAGLARKGEPCVVCSERPHREDCKVWEFTRDQ